MKRRLITIFSIVFIAIITLGQEQSPPSKNNDQEKLEIGVNWVRVDTLITARNGKPIMGLTKEDFLLYDNEKPQEILQVDSDPPPLSIVIVVDQSGSTKPFFKYQKKISQNFLSLLSKNDEVAVVGFDHSARVICQRTSDFPAVERALLEVENTNGGTDLNAGLVAAIEILKKTPVSRRRVIIFISDDEQSPVINSEFDEKHIVREISKNFITVFNVLTGNPKSPSNFDAIEPGRALMNKTTDISGGMIIKTWDGGDPMKKLTLIIDQLKHTYSIFYRPAGEKTGELHRVNLELKYNPRSGMLRRRKYKIFVRKEYYF